MDSTQIGKRLREWVETCFETQFQAHKALDVQPATLYRYMQGTNAPGAEFLMRLANAGCDVTWLLTGTGDMFADNDAGRALRASFDNGGTNHDGTSLTGPSTGYAKDLSSNPAPRKRVRRPSGEQS